MRRFPHGTPQCFLPASYWCLKRIPKGRQMRYLCPHLPCLHSLLPHPLRQLPAFSDSYHADTGLRQWIWGQSLPAPPEDPAGGGQWTLHFSGPHQMPEIPLWQVCWQNIRKLRPHLRSHTSPAPWFPLTVPLLPAPILWKLYRFLPISGKCCICGSFPLKSSLIPLPYSEALWDRLQWYPTPFPCCLQLPACSLYGRPDPSLKPHGL